jgi:hypothetical protein
MERFIFLREEIETLVGRQIDEVISPGAGVVNADNLTLPENETKVRSE